jgi:hypothetical protein
MSIWLQKTPGLNSELMRQAAENAGVSWDYHPVEYRYIGIGYSEGNSEDTTIIKDELKKLLGHRPVVIDEPTVSTDQADKT